MDVVFVELFLDHEMSGVMVVEREYIRGGNVEKDGRIVVLGLVWWLSADVVGVCLSSAF